MGFVLDHFNVDRLDHDGSDEFREYFAFDHSTEPEPQLEITLAAGEGDGPSLIGKMEPTRIIRPW